MRFSLIASALVAVFCTAAAAHADSIVAGGSSLVSLGTLGDTLSLTPGNITATSGNTISLNGQFSVVSLPIVSVSLPVSISETLTVNGIAKLLTFSGTDATTAAGDTLTINALGPVQFGGATVNFGSVSVTGGAGAILNLSLPATYTSGQPSGASAVTPEPSSLALLGTGLLSLAGVCRRRLA